MHEHENFFMQGESKIKCNHIQQHKLHSNHNLNSASDHLPTFAHHLTLDKPNMCHILYIHHIQHFEASINDGLVDWLLNGTSMHERCYLLVPGFVVGHSLRSTPIQVLSEVEVLTNHC